MAKLLQRVVSDAATRVARRAVPDVLQRADTEPNRQAAVAAALEKINNNGAEYREMLLRHVKREVKQLMEESVTRKGVHQECSIITSLCAGVENCLLYGLKRHSLGVFRDSSTLALLQKISRSCQSAKQVADKLQAEETAAAASGSGVAAKRPVQNVKYRWIRVALLEKQLAKVIEYLVENCRQFYEADSIIGDPCDGPLLASLLVGPCALEFDKSQTGGHEICCDLTADEMLQRHRIHSPLRNGPASPKSPRHSSLKAKRNQSAADPASNSPGLEYVQLLHQNSRATLLFGKNNVLSQTSSLPRKMPGYLSLHHEHVGLTVKWTPNSLMMAASTESSDSSIAAPNPSPSGGSVSGSDSNPGSPWQATGDTAEGCPPWESALTIRVEDMVYIHCHSNQPSGCSLVFVAHDGTQKPPLQFPPGGHVLQFLTCLENGLLPGGALDPPLWSHRSRGKVMPRVKRRSILKDSFISGLIPSTADEEAKDVTAGEKHESDESQRKQQLSEEQLQQQQPDSKASQTSDEEPKMYRDSQQQQQQKQQQPTPNFDDNMDFVFRIVLREPKYRSANADADPSAEVGSVFSWQENYSAKALQSRLHQAVPVERTQSIRQACDTMRKQILSRAFYGWLAHVRHMSCVRKHLPDLVSCQMGLGDRSDYPDGLTADAWSAGNREEILRAIYWGGCPANLRRAVWPVLLGFHSWESTESERKAACDQAQANFENLLSEWGPIDAIVRENDRELAATARELMHQRTRLQEPAAQSSRLKVPGHQVQPRGLSKAAAAAATAATTDAAATDAKCSSDVVGMKLAEGYADGESREAVGSGVSCPPSLSHDSIASSASQASNGGVYSNELIDSVSTNWHRIDKDVDRCDRHIAFFSSQANLEKLRNIVCCYVWQNLSTGYIQGFCDLLAPLLIVLEDEGLTLACFTQLMSRMVANFPGILAEEPASQQSLMDRHLANLRATIQVTDAQLYEHMLRRGDYTHFCFCYRWFLLEFKREFCYSDVCTAWETIWAASHLVSKHFNVFVAMALLQEYRGVIIENDMDFTDIIKFYNEMAEHHNLSSIMDSARGLADQLLKLVVENR